MDPIQNDLNLLGVKPVEPGVYNIHTPPLPTTGKWVWVESNFFAYSTHSKVLNYCFLGDPLMVNISISLRNILEIDELRQVKLPWNFARICRFLYTTFQLITLETTMRLYWQDHRLNVTHLLPKSNNLDDYILLHPDSTQFIWFPDIYIGN